MSFLVKVAVAIGLAWAALWSSTTVPVTAPRATVPAPWTRAESPAARVADTLSLDAAIGQLIAAPDDAPGLDAAVRAGRVGRVVVSPRSTEAHLRRLRAWQASAPLPVALETEAERPTFDGPTTAAARQLAASGRPDLAFMTGKARAQAARGLGIQTPGTALVLAAGASDFGPTPGGDVEQALVRGLREGRVLPSARLLDETGLDALDALASAGLMEVHVASPALVTEVKQRNGYNGLVVAEVGRLGEGAVAAIEDGADQIVSASPRAAYDSLARALRMGTLDAQRVRDASRRVLAAKVWSGLELAPPSRRGADGTGGGLQIDPWRTPSASLLHRSDLLAAEVARRSVTVIQREQGLLPLVGPAGGPVFTVLLDPSADAERGLYFANALADGLSPDRPASYARLGLGTEPARYADALDAAGDADVVVLAAFPDTDGELSARHRAFVRALNDRTPAVLVAFGDARLAAGLRRPEAFVVAHDRSATAQMAAAQAIAGQIEVAGSLPHGVAGLAAAGDGVRYRQQALRSGAPEEAGLDAEAAARVDAVMERALRSGAFPGGAVAVGRDGVLLRLRGYGQLTRGGAPTTPDTPYDLASLTKVVGTTAAAMRLVEDGRLDLDAPVADYLPRFRPLGKQYVTVRQLLSHSAGQRPWYPFYAHGLLDRRAALDFIYADTLQYPPGTRSRYSDFDMIVLGEVLQSITGEPIDRLFDEAVFEPLGMRSTGFRPVGVRDPDAAPTERDDVWRGRTLQGEVHDEAASVFDGVAGHAGLFSTASDMARFAFTLANGGEGYGTRLFRRTTIDEFTERVRLRSTYPTGLGWMVNHGDTSAGDEFGPRSFGHTGFTGTSIWIDPDQNLFVVLLTNRVNPSRRNTRIREVRPALADAVAGAVRTPPGEAAQAWGFGPVPADLPRVARR
ncbi:serine hydrolase [Rubrivirga marina]|uniref:Beta-lactamase-related domain-containing protein n=1 Tax=Rubrivirga marina TaxID=1196024 RepID=A0A271J1U7_9BACT|nr:serine hydrolase [Rubrivirga marina]PAP77472.1 hypothetical protein BSZ37_14015 [Rubrivirga marina]